MDKFTITIKDIQADNFLLTVLPSGGHRIWLVQGDTVTVSGESLPGLGELLDRLNAEEDQENR